MYKYCIVPKCKNTTIKTPEKLFFNVPKDPILRKKWYSAVKRDVKSPPTNKTTRQCCEDHFDIETDMENYMKYKLVGGILRLKKGVVPHKFKCQQRIIEKSRRSTAQKYNKIKNDELLSEDEEHINLTSAETEETEEVFVDCCEYETEDPLAVENHCITAPKKSKAVQVRLKDKVDHKSTITEETYFKKETKITTGLSTNSLEMYDPDQHAMNIDQDSDPEDSESDMRKKPFIEYMQKAALLCISREPQLLLGFPKECYFCINLLSEITSCTPRDIMIVLKKIRLYQPNAVLGLDFGLGANYITKIIRSTTPAVASVLKSLIYFPQSSDVQMNLPIPFRKNFGKVQSIIDCFEIEIEKPAETVRQALTWSDNKSCNTIKYLIAMTPDGLISYISPGFGGRASDSLILENCGILEYLPKGATVLADRGFKHIAQFLLQNGYTLKRLSSVSANTKPSKKDDLETKKTATLRIHMERSIRRLRGFGFMSPHACVDLKQLDMLDSVVISACGIVNLQSYSLLIMD